MSYAVWVRANGEDFITRTFSDWSDAEEFAGKCNREYGDLGRIYSVRSA